MGKKGPFFLLLLLPSYCDGWCWTSGALHVRAHALQRNDAFRPCGRRGAHERHRQSTLPLNYSAAHGVCSSCTRSSSSSLGRPPSCSFLSCYSPAINHATICFQLVLFLVSVEEMGGHTRIWLAVAPISPSPSHSRDNLVCPHCVWYVFIKKRETAR